MEKEINHIKVIKKTDINKDDDSDITEEIKFDEKNEQSNIGDKDTNNNINKKKKKKKKIKKLDIEEETEEDKMIKNVMGFNQFGSSKNKSHKDSDMSGAFLGRKAKRIYQRFMNYKPFSKLLKQTYMSLNQEF